MATLAVHLPAIAPPPERTVALIFARPAKPPEPPKQMPDPADREPPELEPPNGEPLPQAAPVAEPPPPAPEAPAPQPRPPQPAHVTEPLIPLEPPPPPTELPRKATAPSRSAAPPLGHSPPSVWPHPPEAPPSVPAAPTPEAPIAADWQRALAAWLSAHKTYPDAARRAGAEGAVTLRFTADRAGHVLNVEVVQSAGSPVLDAAAEAMVRNATLPRFPTAMPQDTVTVTVRIRYTLSD